MKKIITIIFLAVSFSFAWAEIPQPTFQQQEFFDEKISTFIKSKWQVYGRNGANPQEYWIRKIDRITLIRVDDYPDHDIYIASVFFKAEYWIGNEKFNSFFLQLNYYLQVKNGEIAAWIDSDEYYFTKG